VEGVQGHLVPEYFITKRHDLEYTALWPLVPKEPLPVDLGHSVTRIVGRAVFGQHVDEALQGLVMRVKTPSVCAIAVANANVIQTLVIDDQNPANHFGWANMGIYHAARPKLTKHLRVVGPFNIGSVTLHGVSHRRLAIGVAAVNRNRSLVRHAGTRERILPSPVRSRKVNRDCRRQLPPPRPATRTRRKATRPNLRP